jgi:MerR family transcriptional regulator, light-induced transcriptional regulator
MNIDTPVLDAAGLQRFQELRPEAIDAVTDRFYASHGAVYAQFGARGREACREDLAFHLEFLRPVLEFGLIQPMVDYLRWLASVLATRDVPATHLSLSLDWLGEFFAAAMAGPDGQIVVTALHHSKARFLEADDALPAIYSMMPEAWPECAAFESALLAGDRHGAGSLFERCLEQGRSLVDAELHMIQPALYGIGQKWQNNQVTVAQEHLATAISQSVMTHGLVKSEVPASNGSRVLLACVAGNNHSVGLQMVADAFQLAGWEVQYLGANVPTTALIQHLGQCKPDLLGLSVSFAQQLRVVKEIMSRLAQAHSAARPPVIVGGLAINQFNRLAGGLGADAWSPDAASAVASASKLASQPGLG